MSTYISVRSKSLSAQFVTWLALGILAITFLLAESWIIGLVVLLGFTKAFFVLSTVHTGVSLAIVSAYSYKETRGGMFNISRRVQNWVIKKERSLDSLTLKLVRTSKILGLIFSTIVAGPFLTTVVIKALGYKNFIAYTLAFLSSILFSLVWAGVYSGAILALKEFLLSF